MPYFSTAPDGITIVELRYGEKLTEERLRENLPADIVDRRQYRVVQSPWVQCPTCKCPCNRYYQPSTVAEKPRTKV
jgi:hypothetical protein